MSLGLLPLFPLTTRAVIRALVVFASVAPTAVDDADDGYQRGQRWIDETHGHTYTLVDPTPGAAVWAQEDGGGGGGSSAWGGITGTLSAQTDLQAALDSKEAASADLAAIAALSGTGYLHRDGAGSWSLDTAIPWSDLSGIPSTFAPSAHAASHAAVGSDPLTLSESQITGLTADLAALSSGIAAEAATRSAADSLRVLQTTQVIAGTGLTGGGALSGNVTLTVAYGTTSTTACVGNDARLSDARTPTAHAASHASGGGDAITIAESQVTNLTTDLAAKAPKGAIGSSGLTQNTGKMLGRTTAAAGAIEEITVGTGLTLSGGTLTATATVTSVGLAAPAELTVSGSPVTSAGTLTLAWATENANKVFAGPSSGAAATPGFRQLVIGDMSMNTARLLGRTTASAGAVEEITVGTGLTLSGGTLTATATVTSVGLAAPTELTVSGSPVTGAGTLTLAWATENANKVFAGPSSGSAAAPTFRQLVIGDMSMNTARLLGRTTASAGAVEEITVGSGLTLSGGTLSASGGGGSAVTVTTTDPTTTSDSAHGVTSTGWLWVNTTSKVCFVCLDNTAAAAVWVQIDIDVQVFTSNGTWNRPAWGRITEVIAIGAGGGGGGGCRKAAASSRSGGGGGGGGGWSFGKFATQQLGATESVTVSSTGGSAGGGATTNTSDGGNGGNGGNSQFGSNAWVKASGGNGGSGSASGNGGSAGLFSTIGSTGTGGASSTTASASAGTSGPTPGGGGGGSGISNGNAQETGGAGGASYNGQAGGTGGEAGTSLGGAGTAGATGRQGASTNGPTPGGGGGGGAYGDLAGTVGGGKGGDGGKYGGGGGGGGAATNGANGGNGGVGGPGIVVVLTW